MGRRSTPDGLGHRSHLKQTKTTQQPLKAADATVVLWQRRCLPGILPTSKASRRAWSSLTHPTGLPCVWFNDVCSLHSCPMTQTETEACASSSVSLKNGCFYILMWRVAPGRIKQLLSDDIMHPQAAILGVVHSEPVKHRTSACVSNIWAGLVLCCSGSFSG